MKFKSAILLVYFIFESASLLNAQVKNASQKLKCHKNFSAAQLQQDLNILVTTLQEVHPDLYRVNKKEVIDKRISQIKSQLKDSLSYLEFLKLIGPLFTEIGDINLTWGQSPDYIKFRNENIKLFPIQFKIQDDKFYITKNLSSDPDSLTGSQILEINNEKVSAYLTKNYALLPTDGKIKTIQNKWLESYFPMHHSNFWEQPDTFKLKILSAEGKEFIKKIPSLLRRDFIKEKNVNNAKLPLSLEIKNKTAVLTIETFSGSVPQKQDTAYKSMIDSFFLILNKQKIENLILDLRGDGGENLELEIYLFTFLIEEPTEYIYRVGSKNFSSISFPQYIQSQNSLGEGLIIPTRKIDPNKLNFKNKLYVVTDGWTIHSKGYFCAKMKERPTTFFAGEECGASIFGTNNGAFSITLPATKIKISIPTTQLMASKKNYTAVHGVKTNNNIKDPEIKKIITELIKN